MQRPAIHRIYTNIKCFYMRVRIRIVCTMLVDHWKLGIFELQMTFFMCSLLIFQIWLNLACVPWFPGTVYPFLSMQYVICRVHMSNFSRSVFWHILTFHCLWGQRSSEVKDSSFAQLLVTKWVKEDLRP